MEKSNVDFVKNQRDRVSTRYASFDVTEQDRAYFYKHMGHSKKVNAGTYQRPLPLTVLAITQVGAALASSDASKPKKCKLSGKGDTVIYEAATQHHQHPCGEDLASD